MASTYSFDVTTGCDLQEVDNAVNQAQKEVAQRFDFKGSHVLIEFNPEFTPNVPPNAEVKFFARDAGSVGDGKFDPFPITTDDPKFVRLYKVGIPTTFDGRPLDDLLVRVPYVRRRKPGTRVAEHFEADGGWRLRAR